MGYTEEFDFWLHTTLIVVKIKRVSDRNNVTRAELQHLRDKFAIEGTNIIRVETQLKSPTAIQDYFNYEKHRALVEIIKSIIVIVDKEICDENKFEEVRKLTNAIHTIAVTFKEAYYALRSVIVEEMKLMIDFVNLPDPPPV